MVKQLTMQVSRPAGREDCDAGAVEVVVVVVVAEDWACATSAYETMARRDLGNIV